MSIADLQKTSSDIDVCLQELEEEVALINGRVENLVLNELSAQNSSLRDNVNNMKERLIKMYGPADQSILLNYKTVRSEASTSGTKKAGSSVKAAISPVQPPANAPKPPKVKQKDVADKKEESDKDLPVDVGRLDLRVGKIVEVGLHPDAESLYLEKIDVGKGAPLTVVSGLAKHIPLPEMQNRLVVLLCNLKPAKLRGILSEAMVMCASTPEKVELLSPPANSVPGDLVSVEGYPRNPDTVLNPKKKIFEAVAPDLKVNQDKLATYKGQLWSVEGKGHITSQTLTNVNIK